MNERSVRKIWILTLIRICTCALFVCLIVLNANVLFLLKPAIFFLFRLIYTREAHSRFRNAFQWLFHLPFSNTYGGAIFIHMRNFALKWMAYHKALFFHYFYHIQVRTKANHTLISKRPMETTSVLVCSAKPKRRNRAQVCVFEFSQFSIVCAFLFLVSFLAIWLEWQKYTEL